MICSKCRADLPDESFYRYSSGAKVRRGLTHWCKKCFSVHYQENRERQLRSSQRSRIMRQYGLTVEAYETLIAQGCAVCGSHERVVIDHCHETNSVRAPLCNGCNVALGSAGEDPDRLEALAEYLRVHRARLVFAA